VGPYALVPTENFIQLGRIKIATISRHLNSCHIHTPTHTQPKEVGRKWARKRKQPTTHEIGLGKEVGGRLRGRDFICCLPHFGCLFVGVVLVDTNLILLILTQFLQISA